ncbi:cellulose biosynthesis cyclic di-GMP-binding regulatory protein BcsB [Paenibacillus sp. 19GGS1-52]|uniref:cellulose biosynthesis cyclic di-GMP-binding regulatory protein BcsB n=1 Tax=Paenibacillus sp. 19GGS1-52 TaxID=2758563 RepID=UPI001EFBCE4E|nr:cellulose biosynthesis cyclic di-GMP-binding regulatory protein BcsB [Paenibacillus sp. 19GGS1-52]ULO07751.1 cellulose biosynthesis cyclic di-GMP-binding regulatory protein BcsB [Paenibacillus sp. 19GGS1-52]
MKKQLTMLVLCLSLFFIQIDGAAAAVLQKDSSLTYETLFTGTDVSLSGSGSQQQYFKVMDYWNVDELRINLHFQISQITADQNSSVTLSLNGSPFYTFRPSVQNNGEQQLTITAPKGFLKEGSNTLTIQGYLRTARVDNQICSVDNSPDNWLHLFNTSSIAVRYTPKALSGGISDFSERFSGIDTLTDNHSLLAVPDKSSAAELEAATYALSGLASNNTLSDRTIPLLPYRGDTVKAKEAVVLIARYDHVPAPLKALLSPAEDLGTHALIQLVNKDTQPTLVVTSKDESLLIKAGRLLGNRDLIGQLSSDLLVIDDVTEVATPAFSLSSNITFTETGDKLTGPNHQEQTYFVSLPSNRSIADSGKISLDFRYAENLDFGRSLVTVSINGTPIGSKKLTQELANGDSLNFSIPENLNVSGNFSVNVAFDLELPSAICTPNSEQMPWAYISKDSVLHLNTKDRTDLLFNNYPYPFLRDEVYNHVAVVLPEEMDDYSYQSLSNMFNLLGQYASGNTGDVHFYTDSVIADNLKNNNIIAIGTYKNNKVIRDNNEKLYFQYNSEGTTFHSNEKMSIEEQYGAQIGTLQLIDSPYESGHGLLAVTGVSSEEYYLASKLIASESSKWKVYGDGVVTDKNGNINAYRFKTASGAAKDSVVQKIVDRSDVLAFVVAIVLVLTMVILSLLLLLRKHMKKRGDKE